MPAGVSAPADRVTPERPVTDSLRLLRSSISNVTATAASATPSRMIQNALAPVNARFEGCVATGVPDSVLLGTAEFVFELGTLDVGVDVVTVVLGVVGHV